MQPVFNPLHLLDYLEEGQRHRQALAMFLKVSRFQTAHHLTTHSLQFPKVSGARDGTVALTWLADLPIGTFISHLFFHSCLWEDPVQKIWTKEKGGGKQKTKPTLGSESYYSVTGGLRTESQGPLLWFVFTLGRSLLGQSHRDWPLPRPPSLGEDPCWKVAVSRVFQSRLQQLRCSASN